MTINPWKLGISSASQLQKRWILINENHRYVDELPFWWDIWDRRNFTNYILAQFVAFLCGKHHDSPTEYLQLIGTKLVVLFVIFGGWKMVKHDETMAICNWILWTQWDFKIKQWGLVNNNWFKHQTLDWEFSAALGIQESKNDWTGEWRTMAGV